MARLVNYPVIFEGSKKLGKFKVSFPDVEGVTSTSPDEEAALEDAEATLETTIRKRGYVPTPSDLSAMAREYPDKRIRMITVDLDQIKPEHDLLNKV